MIELLPESQGNFLGLKACERLTDLDYQQVVIPRLEAILAEHGSSRILVDFDPSFGGWEAAAWWDDAAFGLKHRDDFERMAVVGAPLWAERASKLFGLIMAGEVKIFPRQKLSQAWAWIKS